MKMRENIKQIIREEISKSDKIKELIASQGFDFASKIVGGIDRVINIVYGGDFEKFVKDNDIKVVTFSNDGLNMYLHPSLVEYLGEPDKRFPSSEYKSIGKFRYGPSGGLNYSFTADLQPVKQNSSIVKYRVVGTSGDSGFGYSFITKRNTLGKRYRQQIFQQIIDKYNLQKYL